MSNDLGFGIRLTADGKQLVGEVKGAREEIDALKKSTDALSASSQRTAQQTKDYWAEQQRAANASAQAWLKGNAAADAAADKAWALAHGYKQVGDQIIKAGSEAAKGVQEIGFATARAKQEMVVLGREIATGNFSRMPGTLSIVAQGLSPVALGVAGVTAALAAGAYAWQHWENVAVESAEKTMEALQKAIGEGRRLASMGKEALDAEIADTGVSIAAKQALVDALRASPERRFNWRAAAEEERKYNEQIRQGTARLIELKSARDRLGDGVDKLRDQSSFARRESLAKEIALLETDNARQQAGSREYLANLSAIADKKKQLADMDKKGQPKVDAEQKHYDALTKSTADRIAALQAEALQTDRLSESEKQLAIFEAQAAAGTTGLTAAHIRSHRVLLENAVAEERLTEAHRAEQKAREDNLKGLESEIASIRKQAETVKYETSVIGLTKEQIALLQAQRGDHTIAIMEERLAVLDATGACTAESEALRDQIRARKELKAALGDKASAEATHAAVEEEKKAYVEMWKTIEHTGKDVFVQVLSNGKSAAEGIGKALKASVIDMLYQMTLKRWIINVSAVGGTTAGGSAFAAGGGSAAGGMGMPWGGSSLLGSGVSWLGSAVGSAGMSAFGTGMGLTAAQAAAASGAYSAAGMSSIGSSLSAGSALGAALPWIALAIGSALGLFGGKGTPTANTGNAAMQFDAQGNRISYQTYYGGSSAATDSMITGMQSSYMQAAANLGIGVVGTQFRYGGNTGRNGQSPNFALGGGGGGVNFYQGETPASEAAVQLAASRAVFAALQGSKLPDYLRGVFDNLNASTATKEQIDNALAFANSLKEMRLQLGGGLITGMQQLLSLADRMAALNLSDLSPLTASERLAAAGGQYATLLAQARAGDMTAVDRLGGAAQTYLQEGRSYYASSQDYTQLFSDVQGAVGEFVGNSLVDSAVAITDLKVPLEAIVNNTQDLDKRIADMLAAAIAARAETDAAVIRAQTEAIVRATLDAARVTVSAQQAGALA